VRKVPIGIVDEAEVVTKIKITYTARYEDTYKLGSFFNLTTARHFSFQSSILSAAKQKLNKTPSAVKVEQRSKL